MTLVGVGHALADAFALVDEEVPKTLGLHPGSFNHVPDYRMRAILATIRDRSLMAGGSAANVVKLAARLGLDTHFVGQCGHDEPGQIFESELLQAGVKVNLTRSDAPTGVCVTLLTAEAHRTVATFRAASGNLIPGLLGDTLLDAADVVVLEGYLLDEPAFLDELISRCVRRSKAIAFDIADGSLPERHHGALKRYLGTGAIRFLFLSEPDAVDLTDLEPLAALKELSQTTTVVLKGQDRGWVVQDGPTTVEIPSPPGEPIDISGSDDGFQAGFFWALARKWSPVDAVRAGRLVAGSVAEEPGTRVDEVRWQRLLGELSALKAE